MKRELKDLTISEFNNYTEIINEETVDIYALLEVFGYNLDDMNIEELKDIQYKISQFKLPTVGVKRIYKVGNRRFKAKLNLTTIKASQFIDLQTYMKNGKLENILSCFLLPQKRNWYGKWVTYQYNVGYNIFELQEFLLNNFKISDANELSAFFLNQSQSLLKVMKDYLAKKEIMMKYKQLSAKRKVK